MPIANLEERQCARLVISRMQAERHETQAIMGLDMKPTQCVVRMNLTQRNGSELRLPDLLVKIGSRVASFGHLEHISY